MVKKRTLELILVMITMAILFTGCSYQGKLDEGDCKCVIYLDNLPDEYKLLNQSIRDAIEISVCLTSVSNEKTYDINLTEKNGYKAEIRLYPGKYDVSWCYVSNSNVSMMTVDTDIKTVTLNRETEAELPVHINDVENFVQRIRNNIPSEEILSLGLYSRKVQLNGQLIDLNNIQSLYKFTPQSQKNVAQYETSVIQSNPVSNVSIIVQNQTDRLLLPEIDCTLVGVCFGGNVVFPKGITVGMDISEICHEKKGMLGTPNYFTGTPLIGIGYDNTVQQFIWIVFPGIVSVLISAQIIPISQE